MALDSGQLPSEQLNPMVSEQSSESDDSEIFGELEEFEYCHLNGASDEEHNVENSNEESMALLAQEMLETDTEPDTETETDTETDTDTDYEEDEDGFDAKGAGEELRYELLMCSEGDENVELIQTFDREQN